MSRGPGYRWTILAVGAFAASSFAIFRNGIAALSPGLRDQFDLSLGQVGLLFTVISIGTAVGLIPWGMLTDRIGERPVLAIGLGLFSLALGATAFADGFVVLMVGLVVCGLAGASATGASGRAVMSWFAPSERGKALGIRQMAMPLGGALGAVSLPLIAGDDGVRRALLAVAALTFVAAVCSALFMRDAPAAPRPVRGGLRFDVDARQWRLGGACALLAIVQSTALGFFVLFLHDHRGISVGAAAGCLAAVQVIGAVGRIVSGHMTDRAGVRLPLLRWVAFASSVGLFAVAALASAAGVLLYPVLIAAGVAAMSWNGLAFTAAAELAGLERAGTALSLQNTIISFGMIVAPAAFGGLVGATSWAIGFAVAAACPLVAFVLLGPLQTDELERSTAAPVPAIQAT